MAGSDLEPLSLWLLQSTGLRADRLGSSRLARAVKQRLIPSGCTSIRHYAQRLPHDRPEQQKLIEHLVVGESWFLREPRSFEQLHQLTVRLRQRPLRVLSCGCSSGEEPYSVVIALLEAGIPLAQLQVEAIDISAVALAKAAEGLYGAHALRGLEPGLLERHFQREPGRSTRHWRLRPQIRAAVRFHQGTLQQQLVQLPGPWHVVFCRNVMLYLEDQARLDLLMAIAARLEPQGMLLVAAAEAPMVPLDRFCSLPGGHGSAFAPIRPIAVEPADAAPRPVDRPVLPTPACAILEPADHLVEARRLSQGGQAEEALAAARRCLYLDPGCHEALELAVDLAVALGRLQEAERQIRRFERLRQRRQR